MLTPALIRSSNLRQLNRSPIKRGFLVFYKGLVCREHNLLSLPGIASNLQSFGCIHSLRQFLRGFRTLPSNYSRGPGLGWLLSSHCANRRFELVRYASSVGSIALDSGGDVVRFDFGEDLRRNARLKGGEKGTKRVKMSKKAKRNELRFFRLKARKKMNSPNPEVRIRYKLDKAKRKEVWLIEKLRKFEVPKAPAERYDPEILTEEEKHYLKRTGEKKKNYVQVGRRGLFGGVVLNMHLHWKRHETVKVICRPCKPGKIHEYADELARLSKGIVIDIKPNNTIIFYRGKNYAQPKVMSPPDTFSKQKALEKYKYEQSLEHTSQFIEKLENELDEYDKYKERKEGASSISSDNT